MIQYLVLFNAYRRTDGRMDRASLKVAPLYCIRGLTSLTDSGNLWMPNQLLCPLQTQNVQTPSHNICSNCLTWFVSMTWLFHNEGQTAVKVWSWICFVILVYPPERQMCLFEAARRLHLFSPATYRTKRSLFSKFSMIHWRSPLPLLSSYL